MAALEANAYHAQPGADQTWDTDVLVVGGGGDGLTAATIASQEGANVILIEKSFFLGGNTMMAGGGYCANAPMVKEYDKYWGDDLSDHTLSTNVGTNTGDGIVMAQAVGADVTGMEIAQMMPSSSPLKGTLSDGIWGDASEQIWIDGNGKRFVNEYAERDVLTQASLGLENSVFYIIYAGHRLGGNAEADVFTFGKIAGHSAATAE